MKIDPEESEWDKGQRERREERERKSKEEFWGTLIAGAIILGLVLAGHIAWEMIRAAIWRGNYQP